MSSINWYNLTSFDKKQHWTFFLNVSECVTFGDPKNNSFERVTSETSFIYIFYVLSYGAEINFFRKVFCDVLLGNL